MPTTEQVVETLRAMSERELAEAVFRIPPNSEENRELARIFLRELRDRDESASLRLCAAWLTGKPYFAKDGDAVSPPFCH